MSHTIGQAKQNNQQSNLNSSQADQDSNQPEPTNLEPMSRLSDADYEFLFTQLLEGITHGWHDHRIIKFFQQLGDRGKSADWVAWLDRYRLKLLKSSIQSKRQLGTIMIRFGELTQSAPEVNLIGAAAHRIGRELLFGNSQSQEIIWEYDGPDLVPSASTLHLETEKELSERLPTDFEQLSSSGDEETKTKIETEEPEETEEIEITKNLMKSEDLKISPDNSSDNSSDIALDLAQEQNNDPDPVAIDIQQVMHLIQEDNELAQEISQKLNISGVQTPGQDTIKQSSSNVEDNLDESSLELIESWFNLGLKQVSAGEFTKAIASWEKALNINPNLSEAWHNRGSALGRLGDYEAAVESFQSALTIDPENYQAWNDRAHALYQLQNWAEAVSSWSNAIKIMPGNHLFWYNRGCALEQLEKWQDAIASYEKALEIKPDFQLGRSRYINLVADNSRPN